MREKKVVVAIVQDAQGRFLVAFNPKWHGYSFPMTDVEDAGDVLGAVAIRAVESDLGCKLPHARAEELEYLGLVGRSGSTGEDTLYEHWLYAVDLGQPLDLSAAPGAREPPPLFLEYNELTSRTDLTWSARDIIREFVENQEAVLAVVTRPGEKETEFLLVWNNNYDGYFFPTQRVKTEVKPEQLAEATVWRDLGYRGPARAVWRGEVPDIHFSTRYQRDRRFLFHVCELQLSDVDLHQPGGLLEQAMTRRGRKFLWLPASRLHDPTIPFSPTMPALRSSILGLIPAQTIAQPLRRSEGGIALFQRTVGGKPQWLAQWNDKWGAFFFVGGHRHEGETFRQCVSREIQEELGLTAADFAVADEPAHQLEYRAVSGSAGVLTAYTMELFEVQPTAKALEKIEQDSQNRWLSAEEIRGLEAHDARPVSITMLVLLSLAGRLGSPW
jgi:8-oxo-dGTP pyrophosphatase MutT (NUDIX family)